MSNNNFDFDQIIIGSGFGGSVSALRLTEKGNRVLILEKGLRRKDDEFAKTNFDAKNYIWMPKLGWKGVTQFTYTNKAAIIHGAGVGGGSQVYANVHMVPDATVFESTSWSTIRSDWEQTLAPFYALAQRMLGTAKSTYENEGDLALKTIAEELGRGDSYKTVTTGVFFPQEDGIEGKVMPDPYFNGDGPERKTCEYCASCTVGCRHNAKNTLMKNYLYFAERNGAEIRAESEVLKIEPITPNGDGSDGYRVTVKDSANGRKYTVTAGGVVVSAGVMGSVPLLLRMRDKHKTLPNISPLLGQKIRTNSETLTTVNHTKHKISDGVSISSFISVDDNTNIEITRYGEGSDGIWFYLPNVPMVTGKGIKRFGKFLCNTLLHPIKTVKMLNPKGKADNSFTLLVMQKAESFIHLEWSRKWYSLFTKKIAAVQKDGDTPLTVSFPSAEAATRRMAENMGGDAGSALAEVLLGTPMTAHIMSGVRMGKSADDGVVSESGEVFGYKNLRVLDASVIPGNLGVNPSLTITALAEYAMSQVPVFDQEKANTIKPVIFSEPLPSQVSPLKGSGDLYSRIQTMSVS